MKGNVIITGGTGFIGSTLCHHLSQQGYNLYILSRNPNKHSKLVKNNITLLDWDAKSSRGWADEVNDITAVINLAGETISGYRWTEDKKRHILQSRLNAGKAIVEAIGQAKIQPKVIIQSSATGYYGDQGDIKLDENSAQGNLFISKVAQQWEDSTKSAQNNQVRHIIIRSGIVIGEGGGMLDKVSPLFKMFIGGHPGNGEQWMSWIHLNDEIAAIIHLLEKEDASGVFNLTAPNPIKAKDFFKDYGRAINRPSWIPAPEIGLKMLFGQMADELLLASQRIYPTKLVESGFQFQFPDTKKAFIHL
jgi:uncharacterized protein